MLFMMTCIVMIQVCPALAAEPLERTNIDHPRLVNAFGNPVGDRISVNQQVQIMSDVRNNQDRDQPFIYIVQVRDSSGGVISLGWLAGNLNANQVLSPALSWTPPHGGEYLVEIFVWNSFKDQSPLAGSEAMWITVS